MTGREVVSGRARLSAEATGQGQAVLMIHAGVTDRTSWDPLITRLGDDVRAIRYDARSYGDTAYESEDGWSASDDALAVLNAFEPGSAVVIGCSMGGRSAIDLTLAHPDRVAALVLIAPSVSGSPAPVLDPPVAELERQLDAAETAGDLDEVNRLEAVVWLDGPEHPGRASQTARDRFLSMNRVALHAPDPGRRSDPENAWDRLGEIAVPVLVLVGALDLAHVRRNARRIASTVPGAALVEFPDTAHLPHLEGHTATLDAVAEFVTANSGR